MNISFYCEQLIYNNQIEKLRNSNVSMVISYIELSIREW